MSTKEHPHAEVLRAIADGVPLSEFEAEFVAGAWRPLELVAATNRNDSCGWIESPDSWKIRRKPQYIMVNGFKVPKPLDVMPLEQSKIWFPDLTFVEFAGYSDQQNSYSIRALDRGIAHGTEAAAAAHAKAMLGIDPEYFK